MGLYRVCPNCGQKNPADEVICQKCFTPLYDIIPRELPDQDEPTVRLDPVKSKKDFIDDATVRISSDNTKLNTSFVMTTFRGYKVIKQFPALGAEADTFLIANHSEEFFLKLYRTGLIPKLQVLQRIKEISEKLREHVTIVYDVGFDEETQRYYEISEYVRYGTLRELIQTFQRHTQKEREAIVERVVSEIAEGINALHSEGIVHRDLKPSNVLVRNLEPLDLVLTDFGISLLMSNDVSKIYASSFKGTPAYIAPEEISNYFGKEIDYWHLGIIVYEALMGKNPFAGVSEQVIIHKIVSSNVEIPSEISQRFQTLLKGLLTRDRKMRWGYEQVRLWLEGRTDIPVYYEMTNSKEEGITDINEWLRAGFTERSAALWSSIGLSIEEAKEFKEYFSYAEAVEWVKVGFKSGKAAKTWRDLGFEPQEAMVFENIGISPKDAHFIKEMGITAYEIEQYLKNHSIRPEEFDTSEFFKSCPQTKAWLDNGFSIQTAKAWKEAGFSPQEARKWSTTGLAPGEAKAWRDIRLDPQSAIQWRDAGFTPGEAQRWISNNFSLREATEFHRNGYSVEDAIEWRNNQSQQNQNNSQNQNTMSDGEVCANMCFCLYAGYVCGECAGNCIPWSGLFVAILTLTSILIPILMK